ncbi:MAG: hypothetical protein ACYC6T_18690 [Thermoleophilia bacterium]
MMRMMREGSDVQSLDVDFGPERVLVVDEEKGVLRYTTRTLQGLGYSVSAHVDAEEAWAEARGGECVPDMLTEGCSSADRPGLQPSKIDQVTPTVD